MTSIAITIPNNALPFATSSVSSPPPSTGVTPTVTLAVGVATVLLGVSVVLIIALPVDVNAFMEGEASSEDEVIVSFFVIFFVVVDVVVGEGSVVLLVEDVLLVMLVVVLVVGAVLFVMLAINKSITFCCLYMTSLDLFSSTPNFFISSFRALD